MRRHYYLHENYLVGENVEVKILSPITTQPTTVDTYTSKSQAHTTTFGEKISQNKLLPATSMHSRITSRPLVDIKKSSNNAASRQNPKTDFHLFQPTASTKPTYVSHSQIDRNETQSKQ